MPEIKIEIARRLSFLESHRNHLCVDGDVHLTDISNLDDSIKKHLEQNQDYYHGKPLGIDSLFFEMMQSKVDMCLIWQNPATTVYKGSSEENFQSLLKANRYIYESVRKYPGKFIPGGWIDPKIMFPDHCKELVKILVKEFGFPIIKMNPAQNQFMIDSEIVFEFVEEIYNHGAIPAFHFGSDTEFTPAEGLERVVRFAGERSIIAIHMGGGGAAYPAAEETYQKARELGLRFPNLKYVLSAKRDTHIESDLISYELQGKPFSNNLICASDAPYGKMVWNFEGFRGLFKSFQDKINHTDKRIRENPELFSTESIQNYLGGNMVQTAIDGYKSILSKID